MSPIDERSPHLGGAQSVLADLARGLAARGHAVTVVAARGSWVAGVRVVAIDAPGLRPARFDGAGRSDADEQRHAFARVRDALAGIGADVVHAHAFDAPAFDALDGLAVPVVHTIHLPPVDPDVVAAATRTRALLATVSRANARAWLRAGVTIRELLPNGVDTEAIAFGGTPADEVAFVGRIAPEKGTHVAIRAARAAGVRIRVIGDRYDEAYAAREVDPLGGADVTFAGPLARQEVLRELARSRAVLMPAQWDEPFGMVALEAQAAGAPVVAFARGGLPEVVADGVSGVLVPPGDERAFAAAIPRAIALDRRACRANALRFSLGASLDAHERAYQRLVGSGRNVSSR